MRKWRSINKDRAAAAWQRSYKKSKKKILETNKNRRYFYNTLLKKIFGNKCSWCGKQDCYLVFHHTIAHTKELAVTHSALFERKLFEAYKCSLICQACHGNYHKKLRRYFK